MSQSDFNIPNDGFPQTRANINAALQALASMSSGDVEPNTTYASQLWHDTDNDIIWLRDTSNSAWIHLADVDQGLSRWTIMAAGIARYPAAAIDIGGAIVSQANGDVNIDGDTIFVDSSANRVGIRTTDLDCSLCIAGATSIQNTTTGQRISISMGTGGRIASTNRFAFDSENGDMDFRVGGATKLSIEPNGNVIINGGTNTHQLSLNGTFKGTGAAEFGSTIAASGGITTVDGTNFVGMDHNGTRGEITWNGGVLAITDNGADCVVISSDGMDVEGQIEGGSAYVNTVASAGLRAHAETGDSAIVVSAGTDAVSMILRPSLTGTLDFGNATGSAFINARANAFLDQSDYRLKEEVSPLSGATGRLEALRPVRFRWRDDAPVQAAGEEVDGFLAHQVAEIVPEAVHGERDAVDEAGNPVHQSIDRSKMIPLLVAALQESNRRIAALEASLAEIEGE